MPLMASFFVVVLSAGIELIDSLELTALIACFGITGLQLTLNLRGKVDELSRGLIGFFLAFIISVFTSQLLVQKLDSTASWLVAPTLICLISVTRTLFSRQRTDSCCDVSSNVPIIRLLICIFVVLTPLFKWAFVSILLLSVTEFLAKYLQDKQRKYNVLGVRALGVLLTPALSRVCQASGWFNFRWGIDEGVALSKSVFSYGINDSIYAVGNPLKYQWLGLSFSGLLDRFNSTDLFATTAITIWIVGAFTLVLGGRLTINTFVSGKDQREGSILLLAISATVPLTPVAITLLNISAGGIQCGMLITFTSLLFVFVKSKSSDLLISLCVLGFGCVLIRTVHIEFVLISLMFLVHSSLSYRLGFRKFLAVPATVGLLLLYYVYFLPSGSSSGLVLEILKFQFVRDIGYESSAQWLVTIIGLSLVLVIIFFPIRAIYWLKGDFRILRIYLLISLLTGVATSLLFSRVSYGELHFLQVPIVALFPLVATMFEVKFRILEDSFSTTKNRILLLASILLICLSLYFYGTKIVNLRSDRPYMYLGHLVGTLMVSSFFVGRRLWQPSPAHRKFFLYLLLLQFGIASLLGHYRTLMKPIDSEVLRPDGLVEVGNWVRSNTPKTVVFATNIFISDPVTLNPIDPCPNEINELSDQLIQSLEHGTIYLPAAHIQRRFLAIGPEYAFIFYPQHRFAAIKDSLIISCGFNQGRIAGQSLPVDYVLRYDDSPGKFVPPSTFTKVFSSSGYSVYRISDT